MIRVMTAKLGGGEKQGKMLHSVEKIKDEQVARIENAGSESLSNLFSYCKYLVLATLQHW